MLLADIERRCTDFGADAVCRAGPTDPGLTGVELLRRAAALRDDLRALDLAEGTRIGLSLPAGPDLLTAIVAVWTLGASFVPIDPNEVQPRRRAIVREGQLAAILAPRITDELATAGALAIAIAHGQATASKGRMAGLSENRPQSEAYVIFTSGSTGLPKGVSVEHSAIAAYIGSVIDLYAVPERGMLIPSHLPPTFDAALTTLLLPLVTRNIGMPVSDPSSATRALASLLRDVESPVLVKTTPSQLRMLEQLLTVADVAGLADRGATIIIGGEALDFADLTRFRRPSIAIFNEYGPTETTVGCSAYRVGAGDPLSGPVPIGMPFPGTTFSLEHTAGGPPNEGELVIAGPGVALGYVNDPDNRRFTQIGPDRTYRSGDRVSVDPEGLYHFLGRGDDQVKVNGYRVELGEIDAALRIACQGVAVAILFDGAIVAVAEDHPDLDLDASADRLWALLPAHMQPSTIQTLPRLPLTAHGKIDRRRIAQTIAARTRPHVADTLAERVAQRWRTLLSLSEIRPDTDFFAAGAHSITALTMIGHLADELGVEVPIALIFDHPTFRDFIEAVRASVTDTRTHTTTYADSAAADVARTPSAAQLAIIGAEGWAADRAQFTVVAAARVAVPDWDDLDRALAATLARHDVLGWRFRLDDRYRITVDTDINAPEPPISVETVDLRTAPADEAEQAITARLIAERRRPIDLLSGTPAARAMVLRTSGPFDGLRHGVVTLIAHHAVVDEASITLLWSEVVARLGGKRPEPDPDLHYARCAADSVRPAAQQHARDAAAHLVDRLISGPLGHLDTTAVASTDTGSVPVHLPQDLTDRVAEAARRMSLPTSALYAAAGAAALAPFMTDRRFPLFVPVTCRRTPTDFATVGCFVSSVPIPVEAVGPAELTGDWARRWNQTVLHATAQADAEVEAIAARLRTSLPAWPKAPRVSLVVETPFSAQSPTLSWTALQSPPGPPKHDLTVFLIIAAGHPAQGRIEWRAGAFDERHAQALTTSLRGTLTALCEAGPASDGSTSTEAPAAVAAPGSTAGRPIETDSAAVADAVADAQLVKDLAAVASTVLGHEITTATDLFAAGAQSVDLVRLCAAIRIQHSCRLDLVDIFDHPTIADLAVLMQARSTAINRKDAP
jgi:amino acid adenylation domain-containing protein